jgi:hypothetical protein
VPLEADSVFHPTPFLGAAKTELEEPAGPPKLLECLMVFPMMERPYQVDGQLAHWPSFPACSIGRIGSYAPFV